MSAAPEFDGSESRGTNGAAQVPEWLQALAPSKSGGGYVGDERNILRAFRTSPELVGLLRYNDFALRTEFTRSPPWRELCAGSEWVDADDTAAIAWFQDRDVQVRQRQIIGSVAELVARDNVVHPVRQYLNGLVWDGTARLSEWLTHSLGAIGPGAYLSAVGRKFLISAVARIYSPGCQVDHTLVIESGQGWRKSTALRVMAARPEWFTDELPDLHSKDAAMQMRAHWIVELGELAALRRSDIEPMKAFLTRRYDDFRPPYQRRNVQTPRQCVFTGSTNDHQYLRDPTGNRRFWPVRLSAPLSEAALGALEAVRDQLWAEAVTAYCAGEVWHLTEEQTALAVIEQNERVMVSQLEEQTAAYVSGLPIGAEVTPRDVMVYALRLDPEKPDFIERAGKLGTPVANALMASGCERVGPIGRGANRRNVYRRVR